MKLVTLILNYKFNKIQQFKIITLVVSWLMKKDILINNISKQEKKILESYDLKIVSINEPIT